MALTIEFKKSKNTKQWYWVMKGKNGEKMAHSETIKSSGHVKKYIALFEKMGFRIINKVTK